MCTACVAQGAAYVGGAVAGLQVMRARARHRLDARRGGADVSASADRPEPTEPSGGADPADPLDPADPVVQADRLDPADRGLVDERG